MLMSRIGQCISDHIEKNPDAKGFYIQSGNTILDVRGPLNGIWDARICHGKVWEQFRANTDMLLGRVNKEFGSHSFWTSYIQLY